MHRFFFFFLSALLSLGLASSGASATQVLRVGLSASLESDQGLFARRFKAIAEDLSARELRISLFSEGAFGNELELLEHLAEGNLAIVTVSAGNAVSVVEELGTLALPGLVETHEEAVKATTGSIACFWNDLCLKKGHVRILGWAYSGTRIVWAPGPLPRTSEGIRDLVVSAAFAEWEAVPEPAFRAGPAPLPRSSVPLYRYYRMHPFFISESSWNRLSPRLQAILVHAGREAQQYVMLMQALRPVSREVARTCPALPPEQIESWVWPAFYDLLGGRGPITRTLDAINWR